MLFATLFDTFTSPGWIAAIVLFFVAIFRDAMKHAISGAISAAGQFFYKRLAGNRLLRRRALRKYRAGLLAATEKIPVPFRPNRPLTLSDIYVSLRVSESQGEPSHNVWELLSEHPRVVVTGPPGAGKSMLLRHLAASRVEATGLSGDRTRLPVLLELHRLVREAEKGSSIEDHLVDAFDRYGFPGAQKFLRVALEKGWLVLLLDGLDEIPTAERGEVAGRLGDFLERERLCPAIITCRSAVYRGELDGVADRRMELEPLEDQQIQTFLNSWNEPMPAGKSPGQLMAALREQPKLMGAARNPLLLTIITHLYTDRPTYALPRSRADFYRQAAEILLDQWQGHLGQNKFEGPEKRTVLNGLALKMQETTAGSDQDRRTVSREEVLACARERMPGLGLDGDQVVDIIREIVERSGLLLQVDGGSRFAFAHLTFQEYFAAEALHNHSDELERNFAADPDTWREVVVLWCGLAADSSQMVERVRLVDARAALACVTEARSVDQALADRILQPVLARVARGEADEDMQRGLGSVAADVRPRGQGVLDALIAAFGRAQTQEARRSVGVALAASNRLPAAQAIVGALGEDGDLKDSVVRLGDLAVLSLRLLQEQDPLDPIGTDCLARIGTPDAAVALAELMLDSGPSSVAAAWGFSHVIDNPGVAERFREFHTPALDRLRRSVKSLTWIWQPFADGDEAAMVWLVGLAAALIEETDDMDLAVADPDPRICTALCTLDSSPLEVPLKMVPAIEELVTVANECSANTQYEYDNEAAVLRSAAESGYRSSSIEVRSGLFGRRPGEMDTLDEFVGSVLGDYHGMPFLLDGSGVGDPLPFVAAVLDRVELRHPLWARLVRALPRTLRLQVLGRMLPEPGTSNPVRIDASKWPAASTKVRFTFERSPMYAGTLGIFGALSMVAVVGAISVVFNATSILSRQALVALVACCCISASWIWMRVQSDPSSAIGKIDTELLLIAVMGPVVLPIILFEEIQSQPDWGEFFGVLPAIGFLVSIIVFTAELFSRWFGTVPSFLLVFSLLLCAGLLALWGTRREAAQQTPLAGLFAPDRQLGAVGRELGRIHGDPRESVEAVSS